MDSTRLDGRTSRPWRGRLLVAGFVLIAALGGWIVWRSLLTHRAAPPPDPRLSVETPFLNIHPSVRYVGDEACARCHPDIMETYQHHPMGRTMQPIASADAIESFTADAHNPFMAEGLRYLVEQQPQQIVHRETARDARGQVVAEIAQAVSFAVGSGSHGRSYLIQRDGYLFQSPITWYSQKQRWDLSPGFRGSSNWHFDRPVEQRCLFCHTNDFQPVAHTINRYAAGTFHGAAIGCERCHGPGAIHVEKREKRDGIDITIVNPKHLEPLLREAVCEQCHLEGEQRVVRRGREILDFRPGLPLHLFQAVFVRATHEGDASFVSQVEQMHASRCFKESGGKLGCISCHDPHFKPPPAERTAFYRQRCLRCHTEQACSLPPVTRKQQSPSDDCTLCHMPTGPSDVQHTAISDHRVPRKPAPPQKADRQFHHHTLEPLRNFHRSLLVENDPEAARDEGIALMESAWLQNLVTEQARDPESRRRLAESAMPMLEKAVARDAEDIPALEAHATALWMLGRTREARRRYEQALTLVPQREKSLVAAATLAGENQDFTAARQHWERAITVSPLRWQYHYGLGFALLQEHRWAEAVDPLRRALQLDPMNLQARKLLVACYRETGERERARLEFEMLLSLRPPDREALIRWFQASP